jgi:FMN phosphatase YigB (HAD superfamily)
MIKVIAFDLWNTLATTKDKSSFGNSVKKIFDVKKTISEIRDIFEETIQTKFWETEYDANKEFCRNLEIAPTEKNVFKMIALREKRKKDVKLFDETIPLLKKIKEKGYKIGLVSNTSLADYDKVVNKLKVLKYIDYPVFSFQVGVVKPDSIIYLELQRKAMVYNNEILMVGDNYEHDVLAPKKLGMNAIYFDKNFNKLKEEFKKYNVFLD